MDVGLENLSLTRNTTLASLTATARQVTPGMTIQRVAAIADQTRSESATSWIQGLFLFDQGRLVEDALVRAAKAGDDATANALAWAAIVWAEPRIAEVVEETLTDADGHFDGAQFSSKAVSQAFSALGVGETARKAASTLLNHAAAVPLFTPVKSGTEIIGSLDFTPTARFVPQVIEFLAERIRTQLSTVLAGRGDATDLALLWKANRWFGLTRDEFLKAARPSPPTVAPTLETPPEDLRLLHDEARRRKQVVLQGAPGTGKTHKALNYVTWATGGQPRESNLSSILGTLPANERTPRDVARKVAQGGLPMVWDIAQFHPSYGYEDFVRTLAPVPSAAGVTFRAEHRILSFLAGVAAELKKLESECSVLLIVDELNRADIARVFGELLYALEYRDAPVRTPYSVDGDASMTIPSNLILIGTMNTADRSIALIDYALRRRFSFITLEPDAGVIDRAIWAHETVRTLARHLFDTVATLFSRGDDNASLAVGHSYFLPSGEQTGADAAKNALARRFAYEVVPLLCEYAAEGLVDRTKLTSTLGNLGISASLDSQDEIEKQLLSWIASKEPPGDV